MQAHLAQSRVAKAFNHILSSQILTDGRPAGTPARRALATSSDFADAAALATRTYDAFGYDAVDIGPLAESWRIERDQPGYTARLTRSELEDALARATR